jgi:hypothetical protein
VYAGSSPWTWKDSVSWSGHPARAPGSTSRKRPGSRTAASRFRCRWMRWPGRRRPTMRWPPRCSPRGTPSSSKPSPRASSRGSWRERDERCCVCWRAGGSP